MSITIHIKSNPKLEAQQVFKIGGTNRANRMIKIAGQREKLEDQFMKLAQRENFKASRSEEQRNSRRAKR